ncbi:MAG TPA: alpha-E domain-containing protein [Chthoniobacteraceae bacterium]|nr:alpha-E domain-containing protein [Chthoniobacteraceae bacterium]
MLSRVADHLCWMARYVERAENLARLMLVQTELLLDAATVGDSLENTWSPVLTATAMEELFAEQYPNPKQGSVTYFLTLDEENPGSIWSCVSEARENARTVRDQISEAMWAGLNDMFLFFGSKSARSLFERSPQAFYERVIHTSLHFDGITAATLPRTEGWHFIQLGRYLERADKTSRFVDIATHVPDGERNAALESIRWGAILRSCSAYATARRLFGGELTLEHVIELLIFSTEFPRSVRFCVRSADNLLHRISSTPTGQYSNEAEKVLGSLLAKLNFSGVQDVLARGLHDYIDDLQVMLNLAGQAIFNAYVHVPQEVNRVVMHRSGFNEAGYFAQQQQQQQ